MYMYVDLGEEEEEEDNQTVTTPTARPRRMSEIPDEKKKPIPKASSLFVFVSTNKFRVMCWKICNHSYFSKLLYISSLPLYPKPDRESSSETV